MKQPEKSATVNGEGFFLPVHTDIVDSAWSASIPPKYILHTPGVVFDPEQQAERKLTIHSTHKHRKLMY